MAPAAVSPAARRSASNQPHAAAAVEWRDKQTGGRTPDRDTDPAPHAGSANNVLPLSANPRHGMQQKTEH